MKETILNRIFWTIIISILFIITIVIYDVLIGCVLGIVNEASPLLMEYAFIPLGLILITVSYYFFKFIRRLFFSLKSLWNRIIEISLQYIIQNNIGLKNVIVL